MTYYAPGSLQGRHAHALPVISLILSGDVSESVGAREEVATAGCISVKPEGVRHSDFFGRDGAVILSVTVEDPATWKAAVARPEWHWSSLTDSDYRNIVGVLRHAETVESADRLFELLAIADRSSVSGGSPPAWLTRVRERICDGSEERLTLLAAESGVHPVYLARAFRKWFGVSPTLFRLRRKTSASIRELFSGRGAAAAAAEAGFADQSHMSRSIRRQTGRTPRQLAAELAAGAFRGGF